MMSLHMEIAEQTTDWRGTVGFVRKRETDSQTELWRKAGNDEQREANIAGSHLPALTDWFFHKHFID